MKSLQPKQQYSFFGQDDIQWCPWANDEELQHRISALDVSHGALHNCCRRAADDLYHAIVPWTLTFRTTAREGWGAFLLGAAACFRLPGG